MSTQQPTPKSVNDAAGALVPVGNQSSTALIAADKAKLLVEQFMRESTAILVANPDKGPVKLSGVSFPIRVEGIFPCPVDRFFR